MIKFLKKALKWYIEKTAETYAWSASLVPSERMSDLK